MGNYGYCCDICHYGIFILINTISYYDIDVNIFKIKQQNNMSFNKASDCITEVLNEILNEEKIELTDESEEELLVFLKPTTLLLLAPFAKCDISKSNNFS